VWPGGDGGPLIVAPMPTSRMPADGTSKRPLHFIILADCSGGMKGKIQALNYAIANMVPTWPPGRRDQEQARGLTRAGAFATAAPYQRL
jgi:hypothetical protein